MNGRFSGGYMGKSPEVDLSENHISVRNVDPSSSA